MKPFAPRLLAATLFLFECGLLAGCATADHGPMASPAAKLPAPHGGVDMAVHGPRTADCPASSDEQVGRLAARPSGEAPRDGLSLPAADRPFRLSVFTGSSVSPAPSASNLPACQTAVEFQPRPDESYELFHGAEPTGCAMKVYRKLPGRRGHVEEPVAKPAQCGQNRPT